MRFETTPRFDRDWRRLPQEHRVAFRAVVQDFSAACDAYVTSAGAQAWPAGLRVRPLISAPGIWEMTWWFAGPNGRATIAFVRDEHGALVRWRRIGDHRVFEDS